MARLTKAQLEEGIALDETEVELPELGGSVLIRKLTAGQRNRTINGLMGEGGSITNVGEMNARLVSYSLVDPVMSVAEVREFMDKVPADVVDRLTRAIGEFGGTIDADEVKRPAANALRDPDD